MCEAIEEIRNDGIEEGIEIGGLRMLFGLVKDGLLSLSVAAERVNLSVEEFEEKVKQISE
mgnify:CR=1 FL=1